MSLPSFKPPRLRWLLPWLLLPLAVAAQNLDQLRPAPVPPQVGPAVQPAAVLIDNLRGIAFFGSAEAAATARVTPGIHFTGLPVLATADFRRAMAGLLDQPVDRARLRVIEILAQSYLTKAGYPFSLTYLPEQDITDGIVRVVVVRSRLDETVAVEGAKYFSPELYRRALRVDPRGAINGQALQADVAWLNRNPFRSVKIEARPGEEPGTTQLVLKVREVRPWRVFAGANNAGTDLTGEAQVFAGMNWGNALGRGDRASLQVTSSRDFEALRSVAGSYSLDLPWRHTLSFNGAYSHTNGLVAAPFDLQGTSWQVAANYLVPLASPRAGYSHHLTFGVDFKSSDNNFTFADIPITDNLTEVVQARVRYAGNLSSRMGTTAFAATLTAAPGGLTDRNEDQYFNLSRAGTKASYVYLRLNASQRVPLNQLKRGLAWQLRGSLQLSSSNLIGSEQFQGGGVNSVRGYEEGEVYKDNGLLLSQELRLPAWRIPWGTQRYAGRVQAYVFEDYARLWSTDKLPGESAVDLHSVGVGLDYHWGRYVSVRAAYGWQLTDSGSSQSGDNARLHLSAQISF